jgi:hypothetical protein
LSNSLGQSENNLDRRPLRRCWRNHQSPEKTATFSGMAAVMAIVAKVIVNHMVNAEEGRPLSVMLLNRLRRNNAIRRDTNRLPRSAEMNRGNQAIERNEDLFDDDFELHSTLTSSNLGKNYGLALTIIRIM